MREEETRDLLKQLSAPMILLGDFNTHNPLWGSQKNEHRENARENPRKIQPLVPR